MVDVVVGEAATAFVHAREVHHPVARKVACDLHVTDEGAGRGNLLSERATWRRYQWSR